MILKRVLKKEKEEDKEERQSDFLIWDSDAHISFCARWQDIALVIYYLQKEADWKNGLRDSR